MKNVMRCSIIFCIQILAVLTLCAQDVEQVLKAKPFSWSGSLGTNMTAYAIRGENNRMNPFHYGVHGNVNFRIYETFELPFAFTYSKFGLGFDRPFYQLGISPRYKWAQVHLGHRNMQFNSYTLAGHTFWGAGVELNPGKFRISAMRGKLRDQILVDARTGQELLDPQFKRTGWGVKAGVGSFSNFVELMLFKAEDVPVSISGWQDSIYQSTIRGQTGKFAPSENLILGLTTRFTLFNRITWSIEAGGSLFSTDVSADSLSDRRISIFTPRTSSTFKWAGKSSLSFPLGPTFFALSYERIQPEYFTMGAYNFVNDMENITISPSGNFWRSKINVGGMVGLQRNNLMGNRSETTRRVIANANINIAPQAHYGVNIAYTNFTFNQQAQAILLDDSLLIRQVNSSLTVMPYYNIVVDTAEQHVIQLVLMRQNAEDLNPVTRDFGTLKTNLLSGTYNYIMRSGYDLSVGLSYNTIRSPLFDNILYGFVTSAGKRIESIGLQLTASNQFNLTWFDGQRDGLLNSLSVNGAIQAAEKHQFRLTLNWLNSKSANFTSYNELIFQAGYTFLLR